MKNILITGANSYIGMTFEKYMSGFDGEYSVTTFDTIDGSWKNESFAKFDVVFHVAGIAHQKITKENEGLYYKVNRDLAIEVANKAKSEGVKQIIFLSTMSVYGLESGVITEKTQPNPDNAYGMSKYQAEQHMAKMQCDTFNVAVLRPPMVYGKNCKGNFSTALKLVDKTFIFPNVKNQRSMLYVENLCSFVKCIIDETKSGIFFPQDDSLMCTTNMVRIMAKCKNKKMLYSRLAGLLVRLASHFVPICEKAFGDLVYDIPPQFEFSKIPTEEAVKRSV